MKINYENEIKNISSLLEGKYKERQDILDNLENINISYFETLDKEIEDMEKDLEKLKIKNDNNYNKNKELEIKYNNEHIINSIKISKNDNFQELTNNDKYIEKDEKNKCKNNINNMVYESEKYINTIKQKLEIINKGNKDIDLNSYVKLITDLNKILSNIKLFEENYKVIENVFK